LAEVMFVSSSTLMASFQCSRHFRARFFPDPSLWVGSGVQTSVCVCVCDLYTTMQSFAVSTARQFWQLGNFGYYCRITT